MDWKTWHVTFPKTHALLDAIHNITLNRVRENKETTRAETILKKTLPDFKLIVRLHTEQVALVEIRAEWSSERLPKVH
jgi:predicted transcriptional regulator